MLKLRELKLRKNNNSGTSAPAHAVELPRENLVMMSAYVCTPVQTLRGGLSTLCSGGERGIQEMQLMFVLTEI